MYSKVLFTAACLLAMVNGIKLREVNPDNMDESPIGNIDTEPENGEEGGCGCGCGGGCGCGKEEEPKPCEDTIIEEYSDSVGALEAADRIAKEQVN